MQAPRLKTCTKRMVTASSACSFFCRGVSKDDSFGFSGGW